MKRHSTVDGNSSEKHARSHSPADGSPSMSQPHQTIITGMSGGTAINSTVVGAMNYGCSHLRNLIDETYLKIKSIQAKKHVTIHTEDVLYRHLTEKGCVVIKGRSGSGKSHLGYALLDRVSKAYSRLPLNISSPDEWNYVPKSKSADHKYVVMIDDMFGSCNFIQHNLNQWRPIFERMWLSVEDGTIWIVITSRPEIIFQAMPNLTKYEIFRPSSDIQLDEGNHCLTVNEKLQFISTLCGKDVPQMSKREIASINTALGFPQCCVYFASNKHVQKKGMVFFHEPFEYIRSELSCMKKDQRESFYVLLLVLLYNGHFPIKELKTLPHSSDFERQCNQLEEVCGLKQKRAIREIAESLCGIYLLKDGKTYMFSHRSIQDVLSVDLCRSYPDLGIQICTPSMLVEFVRTKDKAEDCETENTVVLDEDSYPALANKLKENLSEDDSRKIMLSHPSLSDVVILEEMIRKWDVRNIHKIAMHTVYSYLSSDIPHLDYCDRYPYVYCLSCIIFNNMSEFAKRIIQTFSAAAADTQSVLDEALTCAVHRSQNDLVEMLLSCGARPSDRCFRFLAGNSAIRSENCSKLTEMMTPGPKELNRLLQIAVQYCNVICLKNIIDLCNRHNFMQDPKQLYSQCLQMCIDRHTQKCCISCPKIILKKDRISATDISEAVDVMKLLQREGGTMDFDKMLILASCLHHPDVVIDLLHEVFQIPHSAPDDVQESWCHSKKHHQLLKSLRDVETVKQINPKTASVLLQRAAWKQCKECVSILLPWPGVTDPDDEGNTVFHYMVGSSEVHRHDVLEFLKEKVSRKQDPNNSGQLPIHVATIVKCVTCVSLLLSASDIDAQDGNGDTIVHCLYHGPWPCKQEAFELLQMFIDNRANVNIKNGLGHTPLHFAAELACVQCVQLLVPVSEVNTQDNDGNTPLYSLHTSSTHRSASSVDYCRVIYQLLIEKGADRHIKNNQGQSALHLAAMGRCTEGVKLLTTKKGVNERDMFGNTPLLYIHRRMYPVDCEGDCCELHSALIENGADAKMRNNDGETALHYAAAAHCDESAKILLPVSDVDAQNRGGDTALHCINRLCFGTRCTEMYKAFIEKGANVHIKNSRRQTPLHMAVQRQTVDTVRLMLSVSDVSAQDVYGKTAFEYVVHIPSRCHELCKLFVEKIADENLKGNMLGITALYEAARWRCSQCVRLILRVTDVNVKDYNGNTAAHALHSLIFFSKEEHNCHKILDLLIQKGFDGHLRNRRGQTALHLTAKKQCFRGVKLLLAVSDVNAQDNEGNTAFHYMHFVPFCKDGCEKIYHDLIAEGGHVQIKNRKGLTALHEAAKCKCTKCVELLRDVLDVNAQDEDGNTALHYIHDTHCEKTCRKLHQLLFEMGADGHAKNKRGETPLHRAAREQCKEGVSVLLPVSEVNAQDLDGNTPLHCVYKCFGKKYDRYGELYELLTKNGADIVTP